MITCETYDYVYTEIWKVTTEYFIVPFSRSSHIHRFYCSLSFFSFCSFFLISISFRICFSGLTVSGSSRLNRLK